MYQILIDKSDLGRVYHHAFQNIYPFFMKQMVVNYVEGQETRGINEGNINDVWRKSAGM